MEKPLKRNSVFELLSSFITLIRRYWRKQAEFKQVFLVGSIILLFNYNPIFAQTSLSAGDIAIVGYNTNGSPDNFAILVLKDLSAGTTFYVNDNELATSNSTSFTDLAEGEGSFVVKAGQTIPAGTVITLPYGSTTAVSTTTYDWSNTTSGLSNNNEEIYIYTATSITSQTPDAFIYYAKIGGSTSAIPSTLTTGSTAITPNGGALRYATSGALYSSCKSELLTSIGNTGTYWNATGATTIAASDWTFNVLATCPIPVNLSVSTNSGSEASTTIVTVTATASSAVTSDQTVSISVTGSGITGGDYSLSNNTITLLSGSTTGSVTFTIVDDNLIEGTETATLTISAPSSGLVLGTTLTQDITITDNDLASVVITPTGGGNAVSESGTTDTYTVTLSSSPSADVTITGTPNAQVGISPSELTFTNSNWNTPQTVTISAIDDNVVEGAHSGSISYAVTSSDLAYNGISITPLSVSVTDNDLMHTVAFAKADTTISENGGAVKIWLKVTTAGNTQGTVDLNISNASNATYGSDYTLPSSTLVIPANATLNQLIGFNITLTDDSNAESDEYLICSLINANGLNITTSGIKQHTLYIRDNDTPVPTASNAISLTQLSSFSNGTAGSNSAEISAYCSVSKRLFIANSVANKLEILNYTNPSNPTLIRSISLSNAPFNGSINSVYAKNGKIALALEGLTDKQANGKVVFVDTAGTYISEAQVGAMPDMVIFNHAGTKVLTANEGEPNAAYTNDPEGSISIIDISAGIASPSVTTLDFSSFNSQAASLKAQGIRIYGLNATVAQDFEPEYITITPNDSTAWVTLQENNALAEINLITNTITKLIPLGVKDHNLLENSMDVSDVTFGVNFSNFPVKGMYLPDAIAHYSVNGVNYLVTANEGDSRAYSGFSEESRISGLNLDPTAYPYAAELKNNSVLGKLNATTKSGDTDGDGDIDQIHVYGARSFSIWNPALANPLVYDSKNDLEKITYNHPTYSAFFNMSNGVGAGVTKNRSDDKGPEPEGVAIGKIGTKTYSFIALERIGGIMVYDISNPSAPEYVTYINNRQTTTGDRGAEGIVFIDAANSPSGIPLVITSNEISSTVTTYQINLPAVTITAPAAVATTTNNSCSAEGIILGNPIVSGGYGNLTTTNNMPASFPIGSTTVTWTVTDEFGQTATATQQVTVSDNIKPTAYLSTSTINSVGFTGASTLRTPYVQSMKAGVYFKSLLSVPDTINGYSMVGITDGLGALDNGDGTFNLFMNHELGSTSGITRAHGNKGSFVSNWQIRKSDLAVLGGSDLITSVYGWNSATQANYNTPMSPAPAFNRFCSADLPAFSAFYNATTGKGSNYRIFMHGEEGGTNGYQVATIANGPDKGKSYILGKFNPSTNGSGVTAVGAWENALACPISQDKTIVIGINDGGTASTAINNSVVVYVGNKQNTGTEIDKAGLTNGQIRYVKVTGVSAEITNTSTRSTSISSGAAFTLDNTTSTTFSRPEDGGWDPSNPSKFYFVTTDQIDLASDGLGSQIGRSRLWRLNFTDITNPELGGTIDLLLDGTEGGNMFDNMTIDKFGHVILQEDPGNNHHNAKIWQYTIATDQLSLMARHDVSRFGNVESGTVTAATEPFNKDEESSGVIDMSDILGNGYFLLVDQAHYTTGIPSANAEGGQLLLMFNPESVSNSLATAKDTVWRNTSTNVNLGTIGTGDNCSIASVSNNAPTTYTSNVTDVIWTVTDANGNSTNIVQKVIGCSTQTPTIAANSNSFCPGSSMILSVTSINNPTNYLWSTGATTTTINTNSFGNYSVTVTDNNGCIYTTSNIQLSNCSKTDFNNSGFTNVDDFLILLQEFGKSCSGCREDLNLSGTINVDDFLIFVNKYGEACSCNP